MSVQVEISPMPSRHAVRTLIEDLVGRDVTMKDGEPPALSPTNVVAVFDTDAGTTTAVAVCTIDLAARIGGALGMVPKGGVDDAIKAGVLPENLEDNCYEVLNVLSSVFNEPDAPHVRLTAMLHGDDVVPPAVAALCASVANRDDLHLDIAGYGAGVLSIVCRS